MSAMDIVFLVIMGFILVIGVGQILNYQQENTAKKYFRDRGLQSLLVCQTNAQKIKYNAAFQKTKYPDSAVISLEAMRNEGNHYFARIFEAAVARTGVMQYPCLLRLDGKIVGKQYGG